MTYSTTLTRKPVNAAVSYRALDTINPLQQGLHLSHAQAWQAVAWDAFHTVGEIRFPLAALSRSAVLVDWEVTVDGKVLTEREYERVSAKVHRGIGEDEATRRLILNLLVAGDGTYIELPTQMQVLSVIDPSARTLIQTAQRWWRLFLPDPANPDYGDSSVRAVLGPVSDLKWLERLSRLNSRSRAATAGILVAETNEIMADFYTNLNEAMKRGMQNEADDAALSPILLELPPGVTRPEVLTLAPELDEKIGERFTAAQRRIAVGIDAPAELITGLGDVNHWGVWAIQEDTWRSHLASPVSIVGDLYATVHEALEGLPAGSAVWEADPTRLFAHKSSVRDALDAYAGHAVGAKYVREVLGVGEDAKPDEEDLELWAALEAPMLAAESPLEVGPPRTGREAGLAAQYAVHQTRARLGAKLRSTLPTRSHPDVENTDLIAAVGLEAAAKVVDIDGEIKRSLSAFGQWWAQEIGGPAPNLAAFVAATVAKPAAELEPIDLNALSDTVADKSQQLLKGLIAAIEAGTATGPWWKKRLGEYVAALGAFDLGGDEWTAPIEASAKLLEKMTAERKKALAAKTTAVEVSEIARLVCAEVG